uniref:Uncharacterized protein n=1 Tax=Sparus aurata TaxID=8175 RepID=A0A671Y4Q3_SPAAU
MTLFIQQCTIIASWLKPEAPSIIQWRDRVKDVYTMEKITARLRLKTNTFFFSTLFLLNNAATEKYMFQLLHFFFSSIYKHSARS